MEVQRDETTSAEMAFGVISGRSFLRLRALLDIVRTEVKLIFKVLWVVRCAVSFVFSSFLLAKAEDFPGFLLLFRWQRPTPGTVPFTKTERAGDDDDRDDDDDDGNKRHLCTQDGSTAMSLNLSSLCQVDRLRLGRCRISAA